MADSTRDIELRLRARDLSTAELKSVVQSVNDLSSALDKQLQAASRLEVKEKELRATLQQLDQAAKNVAGLDATIQRFKVLSEQVQRNQEELQKAQSALAAHQAAMAANTATGRSAEAALSGFEKAVLRAQQRLETNIATLQRYDVSLKQAGVDTANLVSAEQQLIATATQIGDARTQLSTTIQNYARIEREAKEAALATAKAQREAAEAAKTQAAAVAATQQRRKEEATQLRSMLSDRMAANRQQTADLQKFNEDTKRLTKQRHDDETRQARQTVDDIRRANREGAVSTGNVVPLPVPSRTGGLGILSTGPSRGAGAPIGFLGLRPYELTNLGYQINDVVSGLLQGQHVTQILAQQGGQFFQIFGRAALRWLPAVAVALGAVTLAVEVLNNNLRQSASIREFNAALDTNKYSAEQNSQALTDLRKTLRDLGVGWDEAGKAIKIAIDANIRSDKIKEVTLAAEAMAKVTGRTVPEAMKDLTEGIGGGTDAFDKLIEKYPAITAEQAKYIRSLFQSGQEGKAQTEIVRILGEEYDKARKDKLSPFQESVEGLRKSWNRFIDNLSDSEALTAIIDLMTRLVTVADKVIDRLSKIKITDESLRAGGFATEEDIRTNPIGRFFNRLIGTEGPASTQGGPGRFSTQGLPINSEELKKLADIISQSTRALPPGYSVQAISTDRPGATVAGTGQPSEHGFKRAMDVRIVDENGNAVPGSMGKGGPLYDVLDKAVAAIAAARGETVAIGSTFSKPDAGHFSLGGPEAAKTAGRIPVDQSIISGATATQVDNTAKITRELGLQNELLRAQSQEQERNIAFTQSLDKFKAQGLTDEEARQKALQDIEQLRYRQNKDEYERQQNRNKQAIEDGRNASAIQAAGAKAVADAAARGVTNYKDLQQVRDKGEAEARADIQKRKTETDQLDALEKQIDNDRRQNLNAHKSALDQLNTATNLYYDNQLKAIEKLNERQSTTDKAKLQSLRDENEANRQAALALNERKAAEQSANEAITTRKELVSSYAKLQESGDISLVEQEKLTKQAFELTAPAILDAAAALEKYISTAKDLKPETIALLTAKVKELRSEVKYVDPEFKAIKKAVEDSFGTNLNKAFDTVAEALGGLIAKTKSWKDVWSSLGTAVADFFAGLLKDIATAVIKAEALKLIGSGTGGSISSGIASLFSSSSGASTTTTAATTAATATATTTSSGLFGLGFLGLHGGGVVGQRPTSGRAPGSWWAAAPRYHSGTVVGLAPDEQAAVLQRGEEVLSQSNPRNILNGGGGSQPVNIRSILVQDEGAIPAAMAGSHGEKVVISHIIKNAATVRQLVKG